MAVHRLTRILPYTPDQMLKLVSDVRAYPEFVPWLTSMRVWNAHDEAEGVHVLDAEAGVGFAVFKERFSTRVRRDDKARTIDVTLIRGPFRHLKNHWAFHEHTLGQDRPMGTRVEFMIDFAFRSPILDAMLQANFDRAVNALIRRFEDRARALYG